MHELSRLPLGRMAMARLTKPALISQGRHSRSIMMAADMLPAVVTQLGTSAADSYAAALAAAPLPTAALTAASLALAGDYIVQTSQPGEFDRRRAAAFAVFGAGYTGVFQYNLFQFLIANLDGTHLSQLVDAAGLAEGSNLELLGAVERTLTNQLLIIPALYYPIFFLITGIAYGLTLQEMKDRAGQLFLPLLRRNVAFWVPVQFVQFAFVQPELQLPFVCVAGLMWNIILSYVSLQADATEDEETDAASETAEQQQQQAQAQAQAQAQEQVGRVVPTTQAEPARNAYEGKESKQPTSSK